MARRSSKGAQLAQYYREVWQTEAGRHVFADLLARSGVLTPARALDGQDLTDHGGLAIAEGMRRVGLHITDQLTSKPGDFIELSRDAFDVLEHYYDTQERKH